MPPLGRLKMLSVSFCTGMKQRLFAAAMHRDAADL
jgi:hypothetical protein